MRTLIPKIAEGIFDVIATFNKECRKKIGLYFIKVGEGGGGLQKKVLDIFRFLYSSALSALYENLYSY